MPSLANAANASKASAPFPAPPSSTNPPTASRSSSGELAEIYPTHRIVLARELTKKFEEYLRGTPAELQTKLQGRSLKGEFVVMFSAGDSALAAELDSAE